MTGSHILDILIALQAAIFSILTLIGVIAPKGSKIGEIAARIGSDIKGQNIKDPDALKKLLEEAWHQSKDMPVQQIPYAILHYLGGAAKMSPEEMVIYAEKMGIENGLPSQK